MLGTTKKILLLALLLVSGHCFGQALTDTLQVVSDGKGGALLQRITVYSEEMPDTAYITARRAEIARTIAALQAEDDELKIAQGEWEAITGAPMIRPTVPMPAPQPQFSPIFSQGRGENCWHFTAFDRLGRNLLRVELRDNGTIWANGEQWVYSKTRKRYQLKRK